ncbi:MAG: acyl--CoA ligase [Nitrospirae bacterium]|nr:acyl--CoA ligase [Nitrospirota bacterium]
MVRIDEQERVEVEEFTANDALENNNLRNPYKNFIVYHDTTFKYRDVHGLVTRMSAFFLSEGIKRKDRICLILPRTPELIISFLAVERIGAFPVPVNYTLSKEDITGFIRGLSPSAIIVQDKLLHVLDNEAGSKIKPIIVTGKGKHPYIPWDKICYHDNNPMAIKIEPDDIAYLNYTTGSGGTPKGAMATHSNIFWNTLSAIEAMGINSDDIHLCMFASFAHPHELFARPLYTGGTLVLLEEINPKTIAKTIINNSVTCMMGLAPMYGMLSAHCKDFDMKSLRIAESGGMYTRPDITQSFRKHFGIPVLSVWGSTETSGISLANTPKNFREDGSCGKVCPYYEVKIITERGDEAGPGEIGELLFKGKAIISGYLENHDFPSVDGYYCSGDLAYRDREGYHYFVERKSGLLKVAGLKVYPLQVEIVLLSHPHIKEAAVTGIEDSLRGMVPKAFITTKDGCQISKEDIKHFCKKRLADYMIPKEIVVVNELPKIGSGKIDKKALRDML